MARFHPQVERLLVAVFVLVLTAPGLGTVLGLGREAVRDGEAAHAAAPEVPRTWTAAAAFPAAFTAYFQDQFAFRARLVQWQAGVRYVALRTSPLPTVLRGRDGWLFYADDGAPEDYGNAAPFSPEALDTWRTALQHTQDWLESQGIAYLFVIAPDKHAVYPEFLPPGVHARPGPTRIDALVADLRAHSTVHVLDLRAPLADAKARERVYHKTDTHWNARGAEVGAREILRTLASQAPGLAAALAPWPEAAYERTERLVPGEDLAKMLGLGGVATEMDLALRPRQPRRARVVEPAGAAIDAFDAARAVTVVNDLRLPRAVVYRDSFGTALVPFLAEHFSRAVYLWEYDVNVDLIRAERPQVVIQQIAGRRTQTYVPYDAVADAGLVPAVRARQQ